MHVRMFYCDHFVLPLPPDHSFPIPEAAIAAGLAERVGHA